MKNIILTESRNHNIPVEEFVAAWIIWVERYHLPAPWETFCMPRLEAHETLETALQKGKAGSLDVMLRMLAPVGYRKTMQSTKKFMAANAKWLARCDTISPKGRKAQGAKLHNADLDIWNKLSQGEQNTLLANAEALAEADIEVTINTKNETTTLCESGLERIDSVPNFNPSRLKISAAPAWVRDFVRWVHKDPFQPRYRKNPHGPVVVGWGARLTTYFWPHPYINAAATTARTASFTAGLQALYSKVEHGISWSVRDKLNSVTYVIDIFKWGEVAARPVTCQIIHDVMESVAKGRRINKAPMNSGWTKVGAFASAGTPNEQVIWDSRVATSVVSRLDAMCVAAGFKTVPHPLNDLGYVNGRGGSRPRPLGLNWRNGYGCWKTQFAASIFVKDVTAYLNSHISSFPKTNGGNWTIREVEQVLFMDGY